MKTTVDIPDGLLEEAIHFTGAKTKRGAILQAIEEYNRRNRVERFINLFGTLPGFPSKHEIEAVDVADMEQMMKWGCSANENPGAH